MLTCQTITWGSCSNTESDLAGLGEKLGLYICNKHPSDASGAGLRTALGVKAQLIEALKREKAQALGGDGGGAAQVGQ